VDPHVHSRMDCSESVGFSLVVVGETVVSAGSVTSGKLHFGLEKFVLGVILRVEAALSASFGVGNGKVFEKWESTGCAALIGFGLDVCDEESRTDGD